MEKIGGDVNIFKLTIDFRGLNGSVGDGQATSKLGRIVSITESLYKPLLGWLVSICIKLVEYERMRNYSANRGFLTTSVDKPCLGG